MATGKIVRKSFSWLLCSVVIANLFLSVNALSCHQCNSHIEEDCIALRLNTPRAPIDTQFLKECEVPNTKKAFCRKTVFEIEITHEHRIVRDCGFINDRSDRNSTCYEADNEGYKQIVCTCFEDGCNSAPMSRRSHRYLGMALVSLSIILGSLVLRYDA